MQSLASEICTKPGAEYGDFLELRQRCTALDPRTALMVQIAAAMACGVTLGLKELVVAARKENITDDEVGVILSIAMAVCACGIRARVRGVVGTM